MGLKLVSLCSGIGGAEVALEPLGFEPVACSEVDPFASAVLAYRFPKVTNEGDLTKADWSKYRGAVDVAVGGFACQSFSRAGARRGLDDPRGQLMLDFLNACREMECRWVLAENVPNLLSIHGGQDFTTFLETVAELWPGGVYLGGFSTLSLSEYPKGAGVSTSLSTLLTHDWPEKYLMSPMACKGIVERVTRKGRNMPSELMAAIVARAQE